MSLLAAAALASAMAAWTWLAWPDVLIDFGREAYVPWRLASGDLLYADIAYFNGPLSPHWNALCFWLFGSGLSTLYGVNAALAMLLAWLLFRLLAHVADAFAAATALAVFLLLFAFGHLVSIGNYNYIAPYSHELTHGLVLLAAGFCGLRWYAKGHSSGLLVAGVALGLAFLTKAEIFLAGTGGAMATLLALRWRAPDSDPRPLRSLGFAALALGLPPALAWALLATPDRMPPGVALSGVLGTWTALVGSEVTSIDFYTRGAGLDDPFQNSLRLLRWAAADAALLGALAWACLRAREEQRTSWMARAIAFAVGAGVLAGASAVGLVPWANFWVPLPLAMLLLAAATLVALRSAARDSAAGRALALRLGLVVAAGLLLAKMALHARIAQYGFALAMPSTLLCVLSILSWIPARLGTAAPLYRAAAVGLLVVIVAAHLVPTSRQLERKQYAIGRGGDQLRTDRTRGEAVDVAVASLDRALGADDSLVVLPEGIMLNYLLRRPSPVPYTNFMPPELAIYGEQQIIAALEANPPAAIALVHKDTTEYGARFFGREYGLDLAQWVRDHYRVVERIGNAPFRERNQFGVLLLRPLSPTLPSTPLSTDSGSEIDAP